MNKLLVGGIAAVVGASAVAGVTTYQLRDRAQYADVIHVEPLLRTVSVPREECRDEVRTVANQPRDPNRIAGTVAGAVVGGVVGNQIGGGRGKKLATVGGAVAGGIAGNKIQEGVQQRDTQQVVDRVCETVFDKRQEPDGFNVTYRFKNIDRKVRMDEDPGTRIPMENGEPVVQTNG